MNVSSLILAMSRSEKLDTEGQHRFSGYLDTVCVNKSENKREEFTDLTYREAMKLLIVAAREFIDAELYLSRLDQLPVPIAIRFDCPTATLLREDPVAFLRMMDPVLGRPQRLDVSMSTRKEHPQVLKPQPIPAGYDTIAESFGDDVYIRRRHLSSDEVALYESPLTGRWVPAGEIGTWTVGVNNRWGRVMVKNLLSTDEPRFFLPRAWNKDGPWISREALQEKYDEFCKEREECTRMHKADT